ncbi:hypothetical protein KKF55_02845 [Patescibacteria group bacterium]|nr:hypothetical protein [Patescibacteria group bacterium]
MTKLAHAVCFGRGKRSTVLVKPIGGTLITVDEADDFLESRSEPVPVQLSDEQQRFPAVRQPLKGHPRRLAGVF